MNKKRKIIITLVCLILIVGGGIIFISSKNKDNVEKSSSVYETAKTLKGDLKVSVSASGMAVPVNKVKPDYDDLEFIMNVDELDVVNLKKDQAVSIEINAFPDKTFKGKIEDIADKGNSVNGVTTYSVTVSFDKEIKGLKDGMTGTGTIITEEKKGVLYIPIEAINQNDEDENYIIEPSNGEEKVIKTGIHNDDYIEVTEGLKEGDEVRLPSLVRGNNAMTPPFMTK